MTRPPWLFNRDDDRHGVGRELTKGLTTRIITGEKSMLSLVRVEPCSEGAVHRHPEEQWGYLLEGECVRIQNGQEVQVSAGDFWLTPANVPHGVRTGEVPAVILDIFSPPREEYSGGGVSSGVEQVTERRSLFAPAVKVGTATLCDAAGGKCALPSAIRSICGSSLTGQAFTVSCCPGDNLWLHRAIYEASPGDVVVASTGNAPEFGYWGDILTRAAISRSLGGLVIEGCVRDYSELQRLGFPIYATGVCAAGTTKNGHLSGSMGQPIQIGQCTISTGDLIVGDSDGVVAVRRDDISTILSEACRCQEFEADLRRRLRSGERTIEILKLG